MKRTTLPRTPAPGPTAQIARLATPLVLGQMGQMFLILVDTFLVGKLGPAAIGGAGLGSAFFFVFTLFGAGTLFGLDYLVSHAHGRGAWDECHYWLVQSVYLALILGALSAGALEGLAANFARLSLGPEVAAEAARFLSTLSLSLPPYLVFIAFRQYLQAQQDMRPAMVITFVAIGVNFVLSSIFLFGLFGFPALGIRGAGLATTLTRALAAAALVVYTVRRDHRLSRGLAGTRLAPSWAGISRLFRLGAPAGVQFSLETGVFCAVTALVSRLGVVAAAAHTIVINVSSFTYMIPLGVSGATAVLVGDGMGRGRPEEARRVGWLAIGLTVGVMMVTGLTLALCHSSLARVFTADTTVVRLSGSLLLLVAVYQIADAVQAVGGGALRGLGETFSSCLANLAGHWAVGFPVGYWLCFDRGFGVAGFWVGLTAGLFVVGLLVLARWARRSRTGSLFSPSPEVV